MAVLPSLRQLRYLVAVADRLNFRQAAHDCFVTQSTLSAGLKELETQLGVELVERDTRSVRVTAAGAEIVQRARALLAQASDLVEVAKGAAAATLGIAAAGRHSNRRPVFAPRHPAAAAGNLSQAAVVST